MDPKGWTDFSAVVQPSFPPGASVLCVSGLCVRHGPETAAVGAAFATGAAGTFVVCRPRPGRTHLICPEGEGSVVADPPLLLT